MVITIGLLAIEQWGFSNSETTVNFPITFGSVFIILGTKRAIQYEYAVAATDITTTKFFLSTRNGSGSSRVIACNWFALGNQTQWGYGTTNEAIFSIPFTKNVFAFIPEPRTTGGASFYQSGGIQGIKDITLRKVSLYQFTSNQMYLVIGA